MMQKLIYSMIMISMMMVPAAVYADSPIPNEAYVASSVNGQFMLEMKPRGGIGGYGQGEGIAYEVLEDGQRFERWRVPFFSDETYLLSDGRHLVAFGPWATNSGDLAVAFYRAGNLLKEYSVKDLLPDEEKYERSVSHLNWRSHATDATSFSEDEKTLTLKLVDGTVLRFDSFTGDMK